MWKPALIACQGERQGRQTRPRVCLARCLAGGLDTAVSNAATDGAPGTMVGKVRKQGPDVEEKCSKTEARAGNWRFPRALVTRN